MPHQVSGIDPRACLQGIRLKELYELALAEGKESQASLDDLTARIPEAMRKDWVSEEAAALAAYADNPRNWKVLNVYKQRTRSSQYLNCERDIQLNPERHRKNWGRDKTGIAGEQSSEPQG